MENKKENNPSPQKDHSPATKRSTRSQSTSPTRSRSGSCSPGRKRPFSSCIQPLLSTSCQLCSKPYKQPRILPCLHSFCEQCLHQEIERFGDEPQTIQCPTCQRWITIPKGGVNAIPENLHLGFEVEVDGYMSKISSNAEKACDACIDTGKGSAVVFCCTCHDFLCSFHYKSHQRTKIFQYHQLVPLQHAALEKLPTLLKQFGNYCSNPQHDKEELKFYCMTCQCLICGDCSMVPHKDHIVAMICYMAKVYRNRMRETLTSAKQVASTLMSAIEANEKMAKEVETSRENAIVFINQTFEQLHQRVDKRKSELLSEAADMAMLKTTALTLQKEQLIRMQEEVGRYTQMTSHVLQTHTDHEVVALGDFLPTELEATLKRVEGVSLTPNQSSDMHVSLYKDPVFEQLSSFGHVLDFSPYPAHSTWSSESVAKVKKVYSVKIESKTSKGERYIYGGVEVKAELRPKSHNGTVVPGNVEDHEDGTYTITLTPQTAGPHQLLMTMNGQHVQKSPYDLDVRHPMHDYLNIRNPQQGISFSGCPSGIAFHDSGDIYVSCKSLGCICVLDQNNYQIQRIIGSKGSGDGQFRVPCGLCIKGDVVYVADRNNHCIQKLTTGGQFLQKYGQHKSSQLQFYYPFWVVVNKEDMLIIADNNNHRVVILDQRGTWVLTINGNISGSQGFLYPCGLALDPQGNIHVCGSNNIKVFTPKGMYIKSYGDLQFPWGIAIDEEGYCIISEYDGNCLSIFDPHGNKIHTTGCLSHPCGVTFDPITGSIYVANSTANNLFRY